MAARCRTLDENLVEIELITKDAFEPSAAGRGHPHRYKKRRSSSSGWRHQMLSTRPSTHGLGVFKTSQTKTLIELIQHRSDIQSQSA